MAGGREGGRGGGRATVEVVDGAVGALDVGVGEAGEEEGVGDGEGDDGGGG